MKRKLFIFLILSSFLAFANAQSRKITVSTCTWAFTQYATNIFKVSFTPNEYSTNENITNAVNLKELSSDHVEVHNAYGHCWNKMLFENYVKECPLIEK